MPKKHRRQNGRYIKAASRLRRRRWDRPRLRAKYHQLVKVRQAPISKVRSGIIWLRIAESIGIFCAVLALGAAIYGNYLAQRALNEESIARAWSTLGVATPGSSGKRAALEKLYRSNAPMPGIDLSCDRMNGGWNSVGKRCFRPTYLKNLKLNSTANKNYNPLEESSRRWSYSADLHKANFSGANMSFSDLTGIYMWNAILSGTNFFDSTLRGVYFLDADLSGAKLKQSDLFSANLGGADLTGADVAGAVFKGAYLGTGHNNEGIIRLCTQKVCVMNLTAQQIESAWVLEGQWDFEILPPYLKEKSPAPQFCDTHLPSLQIERGLVRDWRPDPETGYPVGC